MSTVGVAEPVKTRPLGRHDRAFYSGMAILMALTVVGGFGSTYYFRAFTGSPTFSGITTLTPLLHAHGALYTAWVVLFIVQTALVAQHKVALHRRLGIAGMGLAAAMIVVGYQTAIVAAQRGSAPPGIPPLVFLVVPLFDMVLFGGFVVAAFVMRKKKEAHKRLMLLAYVSIIAAAVARIPGVLPLGPFGFFGLAFVFIAFGAAYDLWSRGRIHPAYVWGGAIFAASVPGRLVLSGTQAWSSFAAFLTS